MTTVEHYLDRYLDPVTDAFTPHVAQQILDLRPEPAVISRVAALAEKSNAVTISSEERDEYLAPANTGALIAVLKAKARLTLHRHA
jgi:hypothetical protein